MNSHSDVVNYLSNEITSASTSIMQFRNRISFSLFVGPFLLLGSIIIAAKDRQLDLRLHSRDELLAAVGAIIGFLTLGWMAGSIERQTWRNVDRWRILIADIQGGKSVSADEAKSLILDPATTERVRFLYLLAFFVILLTFLATGYLAREIMQFGCS